MVDVVPMSTAAREEFYQRTIETESEDTELREGQLKFAEMMVKAFPQVVDSYVERGIEKGVEKGIEKGIAPLLHQFERKLRRRLSDDEHRTLHQRLGTLGPDRLGDVVFDLDRNALSAWLADANAR